MKHIISLTSYKPEDIQDYCITGITTLEAFHILDGITSEDMQKPLAFCVWLMLTSKLDKPMIVDMTSWRIAVGVLVCLSARMLKCALEHGYTNEKTRLKNTQEFFKYLQGST